MLTSQSPRTVAIIQARMGSSRLPGKVLLDIAGQPMLVRVVERARRAKTIHQVIIATTTESIDDPLVDYCVQHDYPVYRGSLHDVLDRYYQAARWSGAETIVRITADCPLIDPDVVDRTIDAFRGAPLSHLQCLNPNLPGRYVFCANRLPPPWGRTYPIGLDTEVCASQDLETVWREAKEPHQREHVMPYFYDHQERFKILLVHHEKDLGNLRLTVDTPEDLELLRQIFARYPGRDDFSWLEVISLLEREPELLALNAQVQHKHYLQVDERRQAGG
jgi:spore coat polysaccharide biosynthesis protein SpsF